MKNIVTQNVVQNVNTVLVGVVVVVNSWVAESIV
jgi:hypothetical protein